jgi:hypothetical protein
VESRNLTIRPKQEWVDNHRKMLVRGEELEAARRAAEHAGLVQLAIEYAKAQALQNIAINDAVADLAGGAYASVCLENERAQPTPDHVNVGEFGRVVHVYYTVREPHES